MDGKLLFEVGKGIKTAAGIEALLILTVAALHFTVVSGSVRADSGKSGADFLRCAHRLPVCHHFLARRIPVALHDLPRRTQFAVRLLRDRRVHGSGRDPVRARCGLCLGIAEDVAEV